MKLSLVSFSIAALVFSNGLFAGEPDPKAPCIEDPVCAVPFYGSVSMGYDTAYLFRGGRYGVSRNAIDYQTAFFTERGYNPNRFSAGYDTQAHIRPTATGSTVATPITPRDSTDSQAFGAGNLRECRLELLHGVYLTFLITPPLMVVAWLLGVALGRWPMDAGCARWPFPTSMP